MESQIMLHGCKEAVSCSGSAFHRVRGQRPPVCWGGHVGELQSCGLLQALLHEWKVGKVHPYHLRVLCHWLL